MGGRGGGGHNGLGTPGGGVSAGDRRRKGRERGSGWGGVGADGRWERNGRPQKRLGGSGERSTGSKAGRGGEIEEAQGRMRDEGLWAGERSKRGGWGAGGVGGRAGKERRMGCKGGGLGEQRDIEGG